MKDLFSGPRYMLEGFGLLTRPGLRRFVAIPVLVNMIIFGGLITLAYGWVDDASRFLIAKLPDWLHWLSYIVIPVFVPVSYTHLTLPTKEDECRSRWSPYH